MPRSKLILIPLAVTVLSASVFCCCIGDLARAHEKAVASSHLPACHRQAASKESAPESHDCDCQKILSMALQNSTIDMKLVSLEFFSIDKFLSHAFISNLRDGQMNHLLAHAPPGPLSDSIPLYLQHSNLRL